MKHSIIIPHRNRLEALRLTLWGLARSAKCCKAAEYEVLLVDDRTSSHALGNVLHKLNGRICLVPMEGDRFNKPRLLNVGIRHAKGEVLTFLDADMIVGEKFLAAQQALASRAAPTVLAYRVRHAKPGDVALMYADATGWDMRARLVESWFRPEAYRCFARAAEHYWTPAPKPAVKEGDEPVPFGPHVFGNSQFSIRRDVLGDLRFDEQYECRGYEDISFSREIWRKYRPGYTGLILTDPDYALMHLFHHEPMTLDHPWQNPEMNAANAARYMAAETPEDREALAALQEMRGAANA